MNDSQITFINAAVLVPVYRGRNDQLRVVLILRSQGGIHGGQLAFPGGKNDISDTTTRDTALREAEEEIGLPTDHVDILEALPVTETFSTGFRIYPYLARITPPVAWRLDEREIDQVIEVDIEDFHRTGALSEEMISFNAWPQPRKSPFFRIGKHKLWGASFRIFAPILPRLQAGEWDI